MRKITRALVVLMLVVMPLSIAPSAAIAEVETQSFSYILGTEPLCDLAADACPTIAQANNGDTIVVTGSGRLSIHPKSVTGSGSFAHKLPDGTIVAQGTWMATELISFKSFGDATPQGLPANLFGGVARIRVKLIPDGPLHDFNFEGVLTVICELGNFPPGIHEGIQLRIHSRVTMDDLIRLQNVRSLSDLHTLLGIWSIHANFNREVSGFTVFIQS